ncbi:hypothetical protein [Histidinibacterium aquaticum]|uniref:AAA+ family ATPase n=1 Tax=Histidinibacterium aquaticum TaxID=2613962 RepID=A0A5J5GR90_9RHOB|nr:hypothetical protein [Histidinibacterium aquaticum]KAA9009912.1 hypothetical protein F3S47_01190 [Histidinibacterium aquaticum]
MRHIALAAALTFSVALPAAAQEDEEMNEGFSLMEEGSRLVLRGLVEELGPAIDQMEGLSEEMRDSVRALASEMGPAIRDMVRLIDQAQYYEGPEVLPNGDIIIRRKPDAPPYERPEDAPEPGEEIEL